ncbi:MAG TPA: hypothetical protein VGO96_10360 [Pyrinomonadaceae bacterium]|jgi:hypothetical protein|nr:hypothetical protein [Pyrinomonadaceae bacterium]
MHYDFELTGRRVRLWQRTGESYEHVLMKALGYAMFVAEFPALEIEQRVGLRYKPDLVARGAGREFDAPFAFWGECGQSAVRKTLWLLKHAGVARLALFKIINNSAALVEELRAAIDARYRAPERLVLFNFRGDIVAHTRERRIARVPESWYTRTVV